MKRETFLKILGGVAVLGAVSYIAVPSFEEMLLKVLKADTKGLNIDEKVFTTYLEDYKKENPLRFKSSKQQFIQASYIFDYPFVPNPYKHKYQQFRSLLIGNFLLSTDFFTNKMDLSKKINYVGVYNPHLRPCANPFSYLYYPAA